MGKASLIITTPFCFPAKGDLTQKSVTLFRAHLKSAHLPYSSAGESDHVVSAERFLAWQRTLQKNCSIKMALPVPKVGLASMMKDGAKVGTIYSLTDR